MDQYLSIATYCVVCVSYGNTADVAAVHFADGCLWQTFFSSVLNGTCASTTIVRGQREDRPERRWVGGGFLAVAQKYNGLMSST